MKKIILWLKHDLKNVVIFFQRIINFLLSRKIINIYNNLAQKHGDVTVKDFRKYEKLEEKKNKLELGINFLSNGKQMCVYLKFLIFKLQIVSNKDTSSIRKRLLRSAITNGKKELQRILKNSVYPKTLYPNSFLLLTSTSLKTI